MYLYELALDLDLRSPELAERARELGIEGVGPNSELTEAQVGLLRSHLGAPVDPSAVPAAPVGGPAPVPATPASDGTGLPSLFGAPGSAAPPPPAA